MQVFGINNGENFEATVNFINNFGLTFPVLRDPSSQVYAQYQIRGITPYPRDCIIDQNGIVRYLHSEYDPQVMIKTIDDLLVSDLDNEQMQNNALPRSFELKAFPNPFNVNTTLHFMSLNNAPVNLRLYDIHGKLLRNLELGTFNRGKPAHIPLNFSDQSSGLYFIHISDGIRQASTKVMLIK